MLKGTNRRGLDDPRIRKMHIKEFSDHRKFRLDTDRLFQYVSGWYVSHDIFGQPRSVEIINPLDMIKYFRIHRAACIYCQVAPFGMSSHHPAPFRAVGNYPCYIVLCHLLGFCFAKTGYKIFVPSGQRIIRSSESDKGQARFIMKCLYRILYRRIRSLDINVIGHTQIAEPFGINSCLQQIRILFIMDRDLHIYLPRIEDLLCIPYIDRSVCLIEQYGKIIICQIA